ncbi:TonB-dependent receptor [Coraliomargarita sp. SDUM461004]|uniref:TonB-dependent receptor n=1 Tax=Thalassobacterium sedimentorum TaxID=3041258 RepID=A0ABU1AP88_9BACT|nr:TonB-dependent receptor [Coraliomargarita sp. SDUM461004]MDQ8195428.1 TonB-dependent receptor [Coraliomargarita sp. SDUM461004]
MKNKRFLLPTLCAALTNTQLALQSVAEGEIMVLDEFVVTGSHLPISEELHATALTEIENAHFSLWGTYTAIESIRKQPFSYGASNNENDSNSGTGSASANLHGLGNLSTLTLINGRRSGGNSATGFQHGGFADLNLIPSMAIREVQVATEGTAVAYGSDAVAGTVNLLLQDQYIGNRVDTSYSDTSDGDASEKTISFLSGQDLNESTHLLLFGSWYQRNAIATRDRARSADADRRDQGGQNQGSPTYPGRIKVDGSEYTLKEGISSPSNLTDYRPWNANEDLYNFSQQAIAVPEVERSSLMAHLTHDIQPDLQVWGEFLWTESVFDNGLAPAPWFGGSFPFAGFSFPVHPTVLEAARSSPYLPAGIVPSELEQVNYRSLELGKLEIEQQKSALRGLLGLRGQLGEWNWETAALYIQTDLEANYTGIVDESALVELINSGAFNPFASAGAVGPGYNNATALQSAARQPSNHYNEKFWSYDLKAKTSIFELSHGPVQLATGIEYRKETIDVEIDPLFESGENLGGAAENSYSAQREVSSFFAETWIPIFSDTQHELAVSLSTRYENYSDRPTSGSIQGDNQYDALVYKAGLVYRPYNTVQLRTSLGTSFRAPTLTESYGAGISTSPIYKDPLGYTSDSARIDTIVSGNPDLDPEQSINLNIGIRFEPDPTRGWLLSIDYYNIKTEDVIVNGAQYFIDQAALGNDIGNAAVIRDPNTQALSGVFANWFNASESITDGIDYKVRYKKPSFNGYWQATLGVNQVLSYKLKASENASYSNYLGKLIDPRASGGNVIGRGSIPEYKGYLELLWQSGSLTLGGTLNYIHSLEDNIAFTTENQPREVKAWTTLDLVASYHWPQTSNDWLANTTLTFGVDNVGNTPPPFAAGAFADGYDSSLYNLEGRRYRISLSREF